MIGEWEVTTKFQSTPSVGRATLFEQTNVICPRISIHALRGEGDEVRK